MIAVAFDSSEMKLSLAELDDTIGAAMGIAIVELADKVKEDAKALCPVDTGALRDSIRREPEESGRDSWTISIIAGGLVINPKSRKTVDYAVYVEYGTSRARPQPFLGPAFINNIVALDTAMEDALSDGIEEAGRA